MNLKEAVRLLMDRRDGGALDPEMAEAVEYIHAVHGRYWEGGPDRRVCCSHCGERDDDQYMLEDAVWLRAWPARRGTLHLRCVELLMGRPLEAADFKDIPMNAAVLHFLRGRR